MYKRQPQARAGLLPQLGAGGRIGDSRIALDEPAATVKRSSHVVQASLSQPLFRADRWFQWQAAKETSDQAKLEFSATQQDLILRSAETYFCLLYTSPGAGRSHGCRPGPWESG